MASDRVRPVASSARSALSASSSSLTEIALATVRPYHDLSYTRPEPRAVDAHRVTSAQRVLGDPAPAGGRDRPSGAAPHSAADDRAAAGAQATGSASTVTPDLAVRSVPVAGHADGWIQPSLEGGWLALHADGGMLASSYGG